MDSFEHNVETQRINIYLHFAFVIQLSIDHILQNTNRLYKNQIDCLKITLLTEMYT